MTLADLTTYAAEKYNITEEHKWNDFPGFSVLCHPVSKKWLALLIRKQDSETGTTIEKCDLRCGRVFLKRQKYDFLTEPTREKGDDWLGINFDEHTDSKIVLALFDFAYQNMTTIAPPPSAIAVPKQTDNAKVYTDTPIDLSRRPPRTSQPMDPPKIQQMQRLYEYGFMDNYDKTKCENFYRQGKFMEDYEDDVNWQTKFSHYFPTYHDMNTTQLREYFTWRTRFRKGIVYQTTTSFAYVYVYELLNLIGAKSAQDALDKLEFFYKKYIDAGYGDASMAKNVSQWIAHFCIINSIPQETAQQYFNDKDIATDLALSVLEHPDEHPDDKVMEAWSIIAKKKQPSAPLLKKAGEKSIALYAAAVRHLIDGITPKIIGKKNVHTVQLLKNAIYYDAGDCTPRKYALTPVREFTYTGEQWYEESYILLPQQTTIIKIIANAIDSKLKEYFKSPKKQNDVALPTVYDPYINAAIKEYEESLRPKIEVDLSSLSQIREDSATTRDSLLTDEDMDLGWSADGSSSNNCGADIPALQSDTQTTDTPIVETHDRASLQPPTAPIETQILRALLTTGDASSIIKANHLMPTIAAEKINEAYYDQFADNIVDCDGETITIVEDYREELEETLDYNI